MILLKDVLNKMSELDGSGMAKPFSLEFVTYDKKRRTGGDLKFYPEAILCFDASQDIKPQNKTNYSVEKKPNHSKNETRNIEILNSGRATGVIRKINILLITKFNNEKVT